jgi:energy-coupling factor transporter transmembrane protein EcfT
MSNLYFGSFVFKNSFIHRLDARIKIFYVFALSTLIFSVKKFPDVLIFTAVIVFILAVAKMDANYLVKNLRKFLSVFLLIFFMYVIFSNDKIIEGVFVLWRFLWLILISLVLTYSTSLSDLTLAIEKISQPLKIFGIKPRNIALMVTVAIRFIPVMFLRLERCKEAMLARLADFKKLKTIKILVITLLEHMFAQASTLSDAMTARLYNEDAESSGIMRLGRNDYISLMVFSTFLLWFLV